jgi:tetratricopeptide (TPR) repeat protein
MKNIKLILILLFLFIRVQAEISFPEWVIEDAYEKELLLFNDIKAVTPEEMRIALDQYNKGQFKNAAEIFEKLRQLNLPDQRLDFIVFALGECYRGLGVHNKAQDQYRFMVENFSGSDYIGAALFRMLEFDVNNNDVQRADSILSVFQTSFRKHALYNSVLYLCAKSYYDQERFGESIQLLSQVPKKSALYHKSCFLTAILHIQLQEHQKAFEILDEVLKNSNDLDLCAEAAILMGDICYSRKDITNAIRYYNYVPASASRYQFALLKIARANLDLKRFHTAQKVGSDFLLKYPRSIYCFEMASVLEQVYLETGQNDKLEWVQKLIHSHILSHRFSIDIYAEIDRLTDIVREWQILEYKAIRKQDKRLLAAARENIIKAKDLKSRFYALLNDINTDALINSRDVGGSTFLAERRYLNLLKKRNVELENSVGRLKMEISLREEQTKIISGGKDTANGIDSLKSLLNELEKERNENDKEYALVIKECMEGDRVSNQINGVMQAKFIDWNFITYQKKKERIKDLSAKLSAHRKSSKIDLADSSSFDADSVENMLQTLTASMKEDRKRLTEDILTALEVHPSNRFNPKIYFRLAELYFDEAGDEFQRKLREYERKMTDDKDTAGMLFPEYNLDRVIAVYQKILDQYPGDDIADDACFYKALALQKIGRDSLANVVMQELIDKYQQSEYYVEANMSIGRYYFDHPREENDQGYKLAEEAFRKVLSYQDHPQYIQALYHLGWCYYMQDRYDDAISVFKYLVEKGNLDFDPSKSDIKQVANPLLRGEAIDYIAISFDEEGKLEDADKFLKLIGNQDYSAIVLKRIGELREEDLDFGNAIKVYNKLLSEYPLSSIAADAMTRLIAIYESQSNLDSATAERLKFVHAFSSGSDWQKRNMQIDTALVRRVDSMAISIGLYLADESYRKAEVTGNAKDYEKTADNYRFVVKKYFDNVKAANACWNLAVILETKLEKKNLAFEQYLKFSKNEIYEAQRREQAALNALALAQSLLTDDTTKNGAKLGNAAERVLKASRNYCELFPEGKFHSKVLLGMGAVYFNRKMYNEALELYEKVNGKGNTDSLYFESLLLSGQCHYGLEQYDKASVFFKKVWNECSDQQKRADAIKLLLQSEFLYAKFLFNSGDYQNAALAFQYIEEKYPGSIYGDLALFNAAGAYEKLEQWNKACESYQSLVNKYPGSKLAPDALFNAANDYEKADKILKAAETYEMLSSRYQESQRAKDALFNLGFCYEKLGKLDKVAEVNELYSTRYPGEKDVESLLLRSAGYYAKNAQYDKAITVYRNFANRYNRSARSVEAIYMIGKCYLDQKDLVNAVFSFDLAEKHNMKLIQDGLQGNNYYAAEAAYQTAMLNREQFLKVKIVLPEVQKKSALKNKSDLLNEAAKAYQRVVQYHSERMFEAAFRIGELYYDFSEEYRTQERPKVDPITNAILERDIYKLSSQLLQKAFLPYKNAIKLADAFDSLTHDQRLWIEKSRSNLINCFDKAGEYLLTAIEMMKNAPIPDNIREKPLHHYQYLKKLFETLSPSIEEAAQYYTEAIRQTDSLKLSDSVCAIFKDHYCRLNFMTGSNYDGLSIQILENTKNLPRNLNEEEREELLFQLEDIVFELQDKALLSYENAIERLAENGFTGNAWYSRIWEGLARLSPEKYGKSFYKSFKLATGEEWVFRADSVEKWNSKDVPGTGWYPVHKLRGNIDIAGEKCSPVWGEVEMNKIYLWKYLFLSGEPGNASVYVSSPGKYKLYINGVLTMNDTSSNPHRNGVVDSAAGVVSLLKGGDNFISVEVERADSIKSGIAVFFTALVDTTKRFESTMKTPAVPKPDNTAALKDNTVKGHEKSVNKSEYRNKRDLMKAIDEYRRRELLANEEIESEKVKLQKLHLALKELDEKIKMLQKKGNSSGQH